VLDRAADFLRLRERQAEASKLVQKLHLFVRADDDLAAIVGEGKGIHASSCLPAENEKPRRMAGRLRCVALKREATRSGAMRCVAMPSLGGESYPVHRLHLNLDGCT